MSGYEGWEFDGWTILRDGERLKVTRPDGTVSEWHKRPATNGSGMYDLCMKLHDSQARLPEVRLLSLERLAQRAEREGRAEVKEWLDDEIARARRTLHGPLHSTSSPFTV